MVRTHFDTQNCSVARTIEALGDAWSLLILREAMLGHRRFADFQAELGISKNVLTQRLQHLVEAEILERVDAGTHGTRFEYRLAPRGKDLVTVITALREWGDRWVFGEGKEPLVLVDRRTGRRVPPLRIRGEDGAPLSGRDMELRPGPGATQDTLRRYGARAAAQAAALRPAVTAPMEQGAAPVDPRARATAPTERGAAPREGGAGAQRGGPERGPVPILRTDRLRLVAPSAAAWDAYRRFYTDGEASRMYGGPLSESAAWARLASDLGTWHLGEVGVWAIERADDGETVGVCGFWQGRGWPRELTWWLLPEARGQGLALEASKAVLRQAYDGFGWTSVETYMTDDNHAARALVLRLGGEKIGRPVFPDGEARDLYRLPRSMELVRSRGPDA